MMKNIKHISIFASLIVIIFSIAPAISSMHFHKVFSFTHEDSNCSEKKEINCDINHIQFSCCNTQESCCDSHEDACNQEINDLQFLFETTICNVQRIKECKSFNLFSNIRNTLSYLSNICESSLILDHLPPIFNKPILSRLQAFLL